MRQPWTPFADVLNRASEGQASTTLLERSTKGRRGSSVSGPDGRAIGVGRRPCEKAHSDHQRHTDDADEDDLSPREGNGLGFFPVWFLDCTACLPRGGWIESPVPLVGGMSYWVVIAVVASSVLAIGKRSGMDGRVFRGAAAVGGVAMAVFTFLALDTRYPGSLPSVFVSVLPGAVASLAFLFAAAVAGEAIVEARDPSRMTTSSVAAAILGPVAMGMLGGLISLVALAFAVPAYSKAPNARTRRAAVVMRRQKGVRRLSLRSMPGQVASAR